MDAAGEGLLYDWCCARKSRGWIGERAVLPTPNLQLQIIPSREAEAILLRLSGYGSFSDLANE